MINGVFMDRTGFSIDCHLLTGTFETLGASFVDWYPTDPFTKRLKSLKLRTSQRHGDLIEQK